MKFGILGCGHIAGKMTCAVKALQEQGYGVEAYAIASRSLEKAQNFAVENGFEKAYGSYEELAQDPDVDLIYIATPHSEHAAHSLLCIEHSKNLLVEKAFTVNADEASHVIARAKENGTFLCEAMWTRFLPAVQMIREKILQGTIGKVETVEADFSMPLSHRERLRDPKLAGGALLDLGVYSLTFADIFLTDPQIGGKDNRVENTETKSVAFPTGVDATDWINLTYSHGQKAYLKTSMVAPTHNEGTIYGTKGFIRVQNLNDMVEIQIFDHSGTLTGSIVPSKIANFYEYEVLACKKAIEEGRKECAEMPWAKTLEIMKVLDGLRNSWYIESVRSTR